MSPEPLVLLATIPGGRAEEERLHERFDDDRDHGEWFRPSDALVALVEKYKRAMPEPPCQPRSSPIAKTHPGQLALDLRPARQMTKAAAN